MTMRATLAGCLTVARCKKCGREFVTLPKCWPAYDVFPCFSGGSPECGGEIVEVRAYGEEACAKEGK